MCMRINESSHRFIVVMLENKYIKIPKELVFKNFISILVLVVASNIVSSLVYLCLKYLLYYDIVFDVFDIINIPYGILLFWLSVSLLLLFRSIFICLFTPPLFYKYLLIMRIYYQGFKFAAIAMPFFVVLFLATANHFVCNICNIQTASNKMLYVAAIASFFIAASWILMFGASIKNHIVASFKIKNSKAILINILASVFAGIAAGYILFTPIVKLVLNKDKFVYEFLSIEKRYGIIDEKQYAIAVSNTKYISSQLTFKIIK